VRRAIVLAFTLALVAGCGSSAKSSTTPPAPIAQAKQLVEQACIKYAQTILSTDPKSGIPQMTLTAATHAYEQAAITARSAAQLDPTWTPASRALGQLVAAMNAQSDSGMRKALPAVHAACDPVIQGINSSTTTTG
jgi:hypothetical protein